MIKILHIILLKMHKIVSSKHYYQIQNSKKMKLIYNFINKDQKLQVLKKELLCQYGIKLQI